MFSELLKIGGPLSMDFIVLASLFILFFAYAMYFGKSRIISAILAFYPAQFLFYNFQNLSFYSKLIVLKGDMLLTLNEVILFFIFFVPINIIIGRFIFSDSGYGSSRVLRTAGFAFTGVILVLIFTYSAVDLNPVYNFTSTFDTLFSADKIFYWNLVPFGLLFFL